MILVLFGPPGSGKGTQAGRLEARLGLVHLSTGDLFREHLEKETELGRLAKRFMNHGQLVPDEVTVEMVRERLGRSDVARANGVILDGFPRTVPQAEALDLLVRERGERIEAVVRIVVPEDELVARLSGRMICRDCQAVFHRRYRPFERCPHGKCQGEHLYQREDDKAETVVERLRVYLDQTSPLLAYFGDKGLVIEVDGAAPVADVTERILEALEVPA